VLRCTAGGAMGADAQRYVAPAAQLPPGPGTQELVLDARRSRLDRRDRAFAVVRYRMPRFRSR